MKWYKYDIRDLSKAEYEKWYSLMSVDKKQRVDRFRFLDDKKRTVTGEMLARKAIAEWCHVSEEEVQFGLSEYGKPFVIGLDMEFNISHSGDMVVCAVDDKPIGIDVEQIRPIDMKVAKYICKGKELIYIWGYDPSEDDFIMTSNSEILTRFFEVWTRKEAFGKCIGIGAVNVKNIMDTGNAVKYIFKDYIVTICSSKIH